MLVSRLNAISHFRPLFAFSLASATQYNPFPSRTGLKHSLQEMHVALFMSPDFQRLIK